MFHVGIGIDGNATDCVLIDQAAPAAAVTCQMARALPAKDRPAGRVLAGVAGLAQTAGLTGDLPARLRDGCIGPRPGSSVRREQWYT